MTDPGLSLPLLLSLCISLAAFVLTTVRLRNVLTPFHICSGLWAWMCYTAMYPLIQEDAFNRTRLYALSGWAELIVFCGSLTFLVGAFLLKRPRSFSLQKSEIETIVPRHFIILPLLGAAMLASAIAYRNLGTFPILLMGKYSAESQIAYSETNQGFVTAVGWGAARALTIWLIVEAVMHRGGYREFAKRHGLLILAALIAIFCNALDGMRNLVIVPFILAAFAFTMRWGLVLRYSVPTVAALGVFFVVVGQFRTGNMDMTQRITFATGNLHVDSVLSWFICYTEPSFFNLNNIIGLNLSKTYGLVTFYNFAPDWLFAGVLPSPPAAIASLQDARMLVHPGLTLRTIYGDLLTDFTIPGSIMVVGAVYIYATRCFGRAYYNPRSMIVYLCLATPIFNIPQMNMLAGIPALLPFILLALLKFRPLPMPAAQGPSAHDQRARARGHVSMPHHA